MARPRAGSSPADDLRRGTHYPPSVISVLSVFHPILDFFRPARRSARAPGTSSLAQRVRLPDGLSDPKASAARRARDIGLGGIREGVAVSSFQVARGLTVLGVLSSVCHRHGLEPNGARGAFGNRTAGVRRDL